MSYDRYEQRREKMERKLAEKAGNAPLDVAFPIDGLSGPELDAQLRRRAERRIKRRNDFYKGLIAYVAINLLLWAIWFASWSPGQATFPWPLFVTVSWGIGIVGEVFQLYQDSASVVGRREEQIRREIELEKMRLGLANDPYEKPKRDQAVRLSDDGELIADESEVKAKHDTVSVEKHSG